MERVLIEFLDEEPIDNIITALTFPINQIIYIGYQDIIEKRKVSLIHFFEEYDKTVKISFHCVGRYDMDGIYATLKRIIEVPDTNFFFDLTGGEDLILVAMGMFAASHQIPMHQMDVHTGKYIPLYGEQRLTDTCRKHLMIKDSIQLNGGCINEKMQKEYKVHNNIEYQKKIHTLWKLACDYRMDWNRESAVLKQMNSYNHADNLGCMVELEKKDISKISGINATYSFLQILQKRDMIEKLTIEPDHLSFHYKNHMIKECLLDSGSILEIYTYLCACETGVFDEAMVGVSIDWDGRIHNRFSKVKDTLNEVDVVLIRNNIPIFISCKNGKIGKEALYELDLVATKFGGKYVKKAIIAPNLNQSGKDESYFLQRADDMGIQVIDRVYESNTEEFKERLAQL